MIEPFVDKKESLFSVRAVVDNKKLKLYPGMYVKIIAKKEFKDVLVLDKSAVIQKKKDFYVFLATEFKGEFEPIKVDVIDIGEKYIIKSGLKLGDRVVKSSMFMLDSDAEINSLY